jgi:prepilin-type N-terminal cleavage/methylation domain-containing protein
MVRRKRQKGFSFLEILFAVFLLAVSAAIVVATLPVGTRIRHKSDDMDKAIGLAQKQLEAIRGEGYSNATSTQLASFNLIDSTTPVTDNTYSFTNSDSANLDNPALILPQGKGTVAVTQADIDLRQVVVTITWNDRGTARTYQIGTLIANL